MKYVLYLFFFLVSFTSVAQRTLQDVLQQYNTRSIPYISVEELRMLQMNDSVVILDAREKEEFDVSHLKSAKFVGFSTFSEENISEILSDKNTPIVVYCSLGIRSEKIAEKLKKEGYTNVENLYGGIFEWKNKEYPIVDKEENKTDSIHGFSKNWSKWLHNGIIIFN